MSTLHKAVGRSTLDHDLIRLFEDEAERHPDWPDVRNRLGLSLLSRGRLTEAQSQLEQCLALHERYAWAALNLAQCEALSGRIERARGLLARSADPSPGAKAYVEAFVDLAAGRAEAAEARLDALPPSLARRPDFLRLRATLMRKENPVAAEALLAEARNDPEVEAFDLTPWDAVGEGPSALLTLMPGMHQLWLEASTLEGRLGRPEQAELSALRGYLHWADLGLYLNQRGFLAALRGDDAAALEAYERSAQAGPQNPIPHVSLAYHWSAAGDLERAHQCLCAALERAPRYADLHHQMGLLERARGEAEAALASFRRAVEINPDYGLARLDMATALFALERWDEARGAYREILSGGLASSDILLHLGEAEEHAGCAEAAERCYLESLRLNPGEAFAHYRLGRLYRAQGDRAGAQEAWKRFLELSSDPEQAAVVEALLREDNR